MYEFCVLFSTGYFWHVTDLHYDHTYATSMLSCNDDVPKPGKYGDYWCDSPWSLVQDSIASMATIKPDVDFILWTGLVFETILLQPPSISDLLLVFPGPMSFLLVQDRYVICVVKIIASLFVH